MDVLIVLLLTIYFLTGLSIAFRCEKKYHSEITPTDNDDYYEAKAKKTAASIGMLFIMFFWPLAVVWEIIKGILKYSENE